MERSEWPRCQCYTAMLQQASRVMCLISPCYFYEMEAPNRFWYFQRLSRLVLMVSIAYSCRERWERMTHLLMQVLAMDLQVSQKFLSSSPSSISRATSSALSASSCCLFSLQMQLRLLKHSALNCSNFYCGLRLLRTALQKSMSTHLDTRFSFSLKSRVLAAMTLMFTLLMKVVSSCRRERPWGRGSLFSSAEAMRQTILSWTSISVNSCGLFCRYWWYFLSSSKGSLYSFSCPCIIIPYIQVINKMEMSKPAETTFTRTAKSSLYNTTNQEYGTPWVQNNTRPEHVDLRSDTIPTYSEIVGSLNDFKRAERLIKSKVIRETLEREGVEPNSENSRYQKKTEFHVTNGYSQYPEHGLNVGPATYRTNNMNYGNSRPAQFQIQQKYFPCNSNFTKTFNGGTFKFNGLNTVKTVSQVHTFLNDM